MNQSTETNSHKKETTSAEVVSDQKLAITPTMPEPKPVVKEQAVDIDGFIQLRQEFIAKVNAICIEGKDYHVIQGKKSLAKGGAEKIASIFQWSATFTKDGEALEMLGAKEGLVAFKCTLTTKPTTDKHASTIPVYGYFIGEGRGAAILSKNANDPNKTLKMAQKSAFIDAVLRASGLSDFFTQDLEDMPKEEIGQPQTHNQPKGATEKQIFFCRQLIGQKRLTDVKLRLKFPFYQTAEQLSISEAKEVIDYLLHYIPETQVVIQTNGLSEAANGMIARMNQAEDPAEMKEIKEQIEFEKDMGIYTTEDLEEMRKVYAKNAKEVMPKE